MLQSTGDNEMDEPLRYRNVTDSYQDNWRNQHNYKDTTIITYIVSLKYYIVILFMIFILLVSQLVLVLLYMSDASPTQKNSSGPHCVVTLFKTEVISSVKVECTIPCCKVECI